MAAAKAPLTIRELKNDLEVFVLSRLDHHPGSSDISLVIRPTKQRQQGLPK